MRRTGARAALAAISAATLSATVLAASSLTASALAEPFISQRCAGVTAKVTVFKRLGPPGLGWVENLGFDGRGGLWASEEFGNKIVRLNAAGQITATLTLPFPGAVLPGPGGQMYAVAGDSPLSDVTHAGSVVRFDTTAARPTATTLATGLAMTNGAAFDSSGNLYLTDGNAIARIDATGTLDPTWLASLSGNDGLDVIGSNLYATLLTDPRSSIVRVPLANPAGHQTVVSLGAALPIPRLLDDLTTGPDGQLYVASAIGQLLRVNPTTGAACILYGGPPLTSARFADGFGSFDPQHDLFLTSEAGEVLDLHLTP